MPNLDLMKVTKNSKQAKVYKNTYQNSAQGRTLLHGLFNRCFQLYQLVCCRVFKIIPIDIQEEHRNKTLFKSKFIFLSR